MRQNRAAFERVGFDPRWLSDVSRREIATTVLGERVAMPVLLAPAGLARLVHPQGELAAARAAGAAGTIFCVSIASSCSIEEIADVASGPALVSALPVAERRGRQGARRPRARASGYRALVLTVDVPIVGNRERDVRNGASLPPRIRIDTALDALLRPRWLYDFVRGPAITFANLGEIAGSSDPGAIGPYVDRELTDPDGDVGAARSAAAAVGRSTRRQGSAVGTGCGGGGASRRGCRVRVEPRRAPARRLAGTLDALGSVLEAVGDRAEVLLDGGVRRGEDVVKAQGARRACVSRRAPVVHGARRPGASPASSAMLDVLARDVDRTLALLGVPRIDDIGRDVLLTNRLVD